MSRLYSEDDLDERGINTAIQLNEWLDDLRDQLVEIARYTNPHASRSLEDARKFNTWTKGVVDFIIQVGEKKYGRPLLTDSVGQWFKPVVSKIFREEGILTIQLLKQWIELRGSGWYRPLPRIGQGKALVIERWFDRYAGDLGQLSIPTDEPQPGLIVLGQGTRTQLVSLDRIGSIAAALDGSAGLNRASSYCLISAKSDLQAVQAYLARYKGRDKTLRAYQKELERFLLWCIAVPKMPLSSVLTDECERYKEFLAKPATEWMGPKAPRSSERWRPFEKPLSPASQKYAVQAVRSFYEWLVRVRYLGGNPWITVADPIVNVKENAIDIEKALTEDLWQKLSADNGLLEPKALEGETDRQELNVSNPKAAPARVAQARLARAAILLMGFGGLRREEAAAAVKGRLAKVPDYPDLWELKVLGKRNKWRTVYLPRSAVMAIEKHWLDRGKVLEAGEPEDHLLSPLFVPSTSDALFKHTQADGTRLSKGFSPDGLYTLVKTALTTLANDPHVELTEDQRRELRTAAPHALRHTFATHAAAAKVDLDVLQRLLGHASLQTTSIYVQAERKRAQEATARFFSK